MSSLLLILGIIIGALILAFWVWVLIKFFILCSDVKENHKTLMELKNWCTEAQKALEEIKNKVDQLSEEE